MSDKRIQSSYPFFSIIGKGHFFVVSVIFYFVNFCFQDSFSKLQKKKKKKKKERKKNRTFGVRGNMYTLVWKIFFFGDEKFVHQLITLALHHPFYSCSVPICH